MATGYFTHSDCDAHVNPPGHPEQVARLTAIHKALARAEFNPLDRQDAPLAKSSDILRCHPQRYLERIKSATPAQGSSPLDADTHICPGSIQAALRGVGGVLAAVDHVLNGSLDNAFVACRPPGHHAETETTMGFCLFGNIAIAAKHALDQHGLSRVAIVDFDVHHGNGTQDLLWHEERTLFVSSHQMPLYPGSGAETETGIANNILNIPLEPGSNGDDMRRRYDRDVFPRIEEFDPDLILISAGFDAHGADPLASLNWGTDDFAWLTQRICRIADTCCDGRVVSTLEGGYDLTALAQSVAAHVRVLMEQGK